MRHKGIGKEETRQNVIDAASRGFRKHGFAGIGVDGIAKAAGVTSGAFYSHLGSKAQAFEEALNLGLDEVIEGVPKFQKQYKSEWIVEFCNYYLGSAHRKDLECGCAMASLTAEVVRAAPQLQQMYEVKMLKIVRMIADGLQGQETEEKTVRAWTFLSILIGGLNLSRAMRSEDIAEEVAQTFIRSAIEAAGEVKG